MQYFYCLILLSKCIFLLSFCLPYFRFLVPKSNTALVITKNISSKFLHNYKSLKYENFQRPIRNLSFPLLYLVIEQYVFHSFPLRGGSFRYRTVNNVGRSLMTSQYSQVSRNSHLSYVMVSNTLSFKFKQRKGKQKPVWISYAVIVMRAFTRAYQTGMEETYV